MSASFDSSMIEPVGIGVRDVLREARVGQSVRKLLLGRARRRHRALAQAQPVMTLPGFGFGDPAMLAIRRLARKAGFTAYGWEQGVNRGNVVALLPNVVERVCELSERKQQPVRLVGWSLGGYIAREVAREVPDRVAHVVTLGSPIIGGPKYTAAAGLYRLAGIDIEAIDAAVAQRNQSPLPVTVSCLYSKADGVVDWRAAVDTHNPMTRCIEVGCSHMAFGFDPEVTAIVIDELLDSVPIQD